MVRKVVQPEIRLPILKEEPFISLNRLDPAYNDWLRTVGQQSGFTPRVVKEADGVATALAFVAAGFGVALVSQPIKDFPAKDVVFRDVWALKGGWTRNGLSSGCLKTVAT